MKKKMGLLLIGIIVLIFVGSYCFHYYYLRKVSFELCTEIPKPTKDFNNSQWFSYNYIQNEEKLIYFFTKYYEQRNPPQEGYDSIFAYHISKMLDYKYFDYIITYQKQLKALIYSPYLAKKEDWIGDCEKKKPLIPIFDTTITDKVYIYKIEKNNKYRAPGP
jgi:hypothetical protein